MDVEAFRVSIAKKKALPRHADVMELQRMKLFKKMSEMLDSFIERCLLQSYQNVSDFIQQLMSRCAEDDDLTDYPIQALFTQGRCMNWQCLLQRCVESATPTVRCQLLHLLPTHNNPLGTVLSSLETLEENSLLLITIMQLDCFPRADFLECLLDVVAESGQNRVCLAVNSAISSSATSQRISRSCFPRLDVSTAEFPSSAHFIDKLFEGLILADSNPLHPFCLSGELLHLIRERYLRVDRSVNELRKVLLLAFLDYCRGCNLSAQRQWPNLWRVDAFKERVEKTFDSDPSYRTALLVLGSLASPLEQNESDDEKQVRLFYDLHCKVMSNDAFTLLYGELKSEWGKWTKDTWRLRLKRLSSVLSSAEAGFNELAEECSEVLRELGGAIKREPLKPTTSRGGTMRAADHIREKTARRAEDRLTACQRERIYAMLDKLFVNSREDYLREHDGFKIDAPREFDTTAMETSLYTSLRIFPQQ